MQSPSIKNNNSERQNKKVLSKAVSIVSLLGFSASISAAGLEIPQRGIKEMGIGYAGSAALLEDATAVGNNPAGLTRLQGTSLSGGLTLLRPEFDYDVDVHRELIEDVGGQVPSDLSGDDSIDGLAAAPHFYFAHQISDTAAFGIGVYGMYGSATEYDQDWVGRYHATETEITGVNINPAFAFKVSDSLSVGMGVMIQRLDGRFDNKIDVGYVVADEVITQLEGEDAVLEADDGGELTYNQKDVVDILAHNFDVDNSIEVDSWGYGFSFGVLYEPNADTRIGFDYRSSIRHVGEGRADRPQTLDPEYEAALADAINEAIPDGARVVDGVTSCITNLFGCLTGGGDELTIEQLGEEGAAKAVGPLGAAGGNVQTTINMPEIATLSFYHRILSSDWAVVGGATWTNWSRLDEIRFTYTDASDRGGSDITGTGDDVRRRDLVQPFDWESTWRYGLGGIYDGFEQWTIRFGASYDESPVPDESRRTPRGPDNDRIIGAVGASWQATDSLSVDMAYTYTDFKKSEIDNRENPAGTQHRILGTYDGNIHSLGAQLNYRF